MKTNVDAVIGAIAGDPFSSYFSPNIQMFHGGHRMTNAVLRDSIIPFAKSILQL